MGLFSGRNLRMAKELLEKNRHKVGDMVGKATEQVDKASGGKTANMSKKAEEAARKYSAGSSATHHGAHPDAAPEMSQEEAEERFKRQQKNDRLKIHFCALDKIPVLMIPYTKHGEIPQLICGFLCENSDWGFEEPPEEKINA